jgi:hypothetical protein
MGSNSQETEDESEEDAPEPSPAPERVPPTLFPLLERAKEGPIGVEMATMDLG